MHIIAHRGEWTNSQDEKKPNSIESFHLALDHGFGIEVDIRDLDNKLVISHNPPDMRSPFLVDILEYYLQNQCTSTIALNVKADGLQPILKSILNRYHIQNYFTFDMSIPNTLNDCEAHLKYFLRQSEYEQNPYTLQDLYERCSGIWIDQFEYSQTILEKNLYSISLHLMRGKSICFVSPELHPWGCPLYQDIWKRIKNIIQSLPIEQIKKFSLCTDYPQQAEEYFNARD